jgi:hypothetical protein
MSATAPALPSSPSPDWQSIYTSLQSQAAIPDPTYTVNTGPAWIFRGMCVDLSAVAQQLTAAATPPASIEVYADVVLIPAATTLSLTATGVYIAARRVEIGTSAQVNMDFSSFSSLTFTVVAAETSGSLAVNATGSGVQATTLTIGPLSALGASAGLQNGAPALSDVTAFSTFMLHQGTDFALTLNSVFEFATVLFSQLPQVATTSAGMAFGDAATQTTIIASMLQWIATATAPLSAQDTAIAARFLDASALQGQLQAITGATSSFVPYLDSSLYSTELQTYTTAVESAIQQLDALRTQQVTDDLFQKAATVLGQNSADVGAGLQALIEQAGRICRMPRPRSSTHSLR